MAAHNGSSTTTGALFRLAPAYDELATRYRGIRALSAPPEGGKRRHRSAASARSGAATLSIHSVALTPGHIAVSLQQGRLLAVFDAVPSQCHLSASELHSLHAFLRSPPQADMEPFAPMLALHTADSAIVHMQFVAPAACALSQQSATSPTRLLTVQSDASFLLWDYSAAQAAWSFTSRGVLPTAQQRHSRSVTTALHCGSHNVLLWCESYRGKTFMFRAALPALAAIQLAELTTAESAAVIPLTVSADAAVTLLETQHGVLIRSAAASSTCHYYHLASQQLIRLPPPTPSTVFYHVHAATKQLLSLSAHGAVHLLQETAASQASSSLLSAPVARWQQTAQLSPSADDEDESLFPLPPSALFFAFQQYLCVVTPNKQQHTPSAASSLFSFFTLPGGVFVDRFHSSLQPPSVTPCTAALGFGGGGVLLHAGDELHCVVAPSVASLLAHLTAVSPHSDYLRRIEDDGGLVPSETFASASFSPAFAPLQPNLYEETSSLPASATNSPLLSLHRSLSPPASLLIPSLPYPYLSHVGAQLASGYGASLSAQREQLVIDRWLGCATAGSEADIVPSHIVRQHTTADAANTRKDASRVRCVGLSKEATLRQATACLQAPALPAAMTLLPSHAHYQHGHKHDQQQEAVVRRELDAWLARMDEQRAEDKAHSSEEGFYSGNEKQDDCRTPLNESLLPLLSSLRATMERIDSVPVGAASPKAADLAALPSLLALPTLVPLSTQLSRAMANRSSSSPSALPTHDASLSTLALSHPAAAFAHLRSLLGFDQLAPLSSSDRQAGVHPNLLLLNDEIRLKQELGVWGLNVPINSAALQRGDAMPAFELMCRLYDAVQPERLSAFVAVMQREVGGAEASESGGARKWQRAVAGRSFGRYCERALRCLPPLMVGECEAEKLQERAAARCWLLQESGRLTDAVALRLSLARQLHTSSIDDAVRSQHEQAAVALAYQVSPECVTSAASDGLTAEEEEEELDALRAALYHLITSYLFERAARSGGDERTSGEGEESSEEEREARALEAVLAGLDGRVKSLRHPHFSAQHLSMLMGQPLHADDSDEDEDEG